MILKKAILEIENSKRPHIAIDLCSEVVIGEKGAIDIAQAIKKNGNLTFGSLTSNLHNSLLDDPRPYRKNVKILVSIMFDWLYFFDDILYYHKGLEKACING